MVELQRKYKTQIEEMIEACQRSAQLGYGAGSGGNATYRVDENVVLITPSGIVKRKIRFEDICVIDMDANALYIPKDRKPSGEYFMHLHILKSRSDVKAIMHAHPPILIGMSLTQEGAEAMVKPVLPDAATFLGPIMTIPYVRPNGEELGYSFDRYIMNANAFVMGNHGCLVCSASSIADTVDACQVMETQAKAILICKIFGNDIRTLNSRNMEGMDKLLQKRGEIMPGSPGRCSTMSELFAASQSL